MKLSKSKRANVNYLAKIVDIKNFRAHSNPEVTRLKCCTIDGFNIITGIDSQPGLYVYFPTACCINPDFLRYCNLYRHKELNNDPEQTGMFENNGRVKAIRLKNELSEGFILPVVQFQNYIMSVTNKEIEVEAGIEFDIVEHEGKEFCTSQRDNKGKEELHVTTKRRKSKESARLLMNSLDSTTIEFVSPKTVMF